MTNLTPEQKLLAEWEEEYENNEKGLNFEFEDGTTPADWIAQGFTPVEAANWRLAGVFDAESASRLVILGTCADEMSYHPTEADEEELNLVYIGYSVGYMFANGDLSEGQFAALKKKVQK